MKSGEKQKYLDLFIGESFKEWERLEFSWAAAFWSFFWFWWRKMWLVGCGVIVVFYGSNFLLHGVLDGFVNYYVVEVVHLASMAAATGFAAPKILVWWATWRVGLLRKQYSQLEDAQFEAILALKGGTNVMAVVWVTLGVFAVMCGVVLLLSLV